MQCVKDIEFYNLGLGEYYTFASISGSGTGDLLDALIDSFPIKPEPTQEEIALPRFAVVGDQMLENQVLSMP
jgi:GTP-binding protein